MNAPANAKYQAMQGVLQANPAWVKLLGLCPLLAVSNSLVNALGLAFASTLVLVGANTTVAALRSLIPTFARLPVFMLIIASFTTCAVLWLEAYAFGLYNQIALFVQIIVTNCMILARIEQFASRQPVALALLDALATAAGFAIALVLLGSVRELLATGVLGAGLDALLGPAATHWQLQLLPQGWQIPLAALPPGAFIVAGLLLGFGNSIYQRFNKSTQTLINEPTNAKQP